MSNISQYIGKKYKYIHNVPLMLGDIRLYDPNNSDAFHTLYTPHRFLKEDDIFTILNIISVTDHRVEAFECQHETLRINFTLRAESLVAAEYFKEVTKEENHEGQIYNKYTGEWIWL